MRRIKSLSLRLVTLCIAALPVAEAGKVWSQIGPPFPLGAATPSEVCGECHQAIYREFTTGFGSDLQYLPIIYRSLTNDAVALPATISASATGHAYAGVDPWALQARAFEN